MKTILFILKQLGIMILTALGVILLLPHTIYVAAKAVIKTNIITDAPWKNAILFLPMKFSFVNEGNIAGLQYVSVSYETITDSNEISKICKMLVNDGVSDTVLQITIGPRQLLAIKTKWASIINEDTNTLLVGVLPVQFKNNRVSRDEIELAIDLLNKGIVEKVIDEEFEQELIKKVFGENARLRRRGDKDDDKQGDH